MLCQGPEALGKGQKTIGKAFAKGCPRQRPIGKFLDGKGSLCQGLFIGHSAKKSSRHGAEPVSGFFAESRSSAKKYFFKNNLCRGLSSDPRQRNFINFF